MKLIHAALVMALLLIFGTTVLEGQEAKMVTIEPGGYAKIEKGRVTRVVSGDGKVIAGAEFSNEESREVKEYLVPSYLPPLTLDQKLVAAVLKGDTRKVKDLLLEGVNVDAVNGYGASALQSASYRPEIMKALISSGANVNHKDDLGNTPLINATSLGNIEAVRILCENGADVMQKNKFGETVFDIAKRHNDIHDLLLNTELYE